MQAQGSYQDLLDRNIIDATFLAHDNESTEAGTVASEQTLAKVKGCMKAMRDTVQDRVARRGRVTLAMDQLSMRKGRLTVREDRKKGAVAGALVCKYFNAMGSVVCMAVLLFVFLFAAIGKVAGDVWLTVWLNDGLNLACDVNNTAFAATEFNASTATNCSDEAEFGNFFYVGIYVVIVAVGSVLFALQGCTMQFLSLLASSMLQRKAFATMLQATMGFFDSTPTGRILSRFSGDIDQIDNLLPETLEKVLTFSFQILGTIAVIAVVLPWFLVVLVPVVIIFAVVVVPFRRAIRQVKRIESISRSPILNHIQAAVAGVANIAAYAQGSRYRLEFLEILDASSRSTLAFNAVSRWFGWRVDAVPNLIIVSTATICCFYYGTVSGARLGLAITYAISIGGVLQYLVRLVSQAEAYFTSVERVCYFEENTPQEPDTRTKLSAEHARTISTTLPNGPGCDHRLSELNTPTWPTAGAIKFTNFTARLET